MKQVYLLDLKKYDAGQIAAGLRNAAQALGVSLDQKAAVLLADCPWAHPKYAPHAHTHPLFIEGVAQALQPATLTLAAHSVPNFPTRYSLKSTDYAAVASRTKARLLPVDEAASRAVKVEGGKVLKEAKLPVSWLEAPFRVLMPKLRQSTQAPFAGALRQLQTLLPQSAQLQDNHLLPDKMVDLLGHAPVDLIVVDAVQALHQGGEVSGRPVDLGVIIVGTDALAVDWVSALALGLDPGAVDFLQEAAARSLGPVSLGDIEILGDLSLDDLRQRAQKVELVDPNPVNFPFPPQIKTLRSEKARQSGVSGVLADVLYLLKNADLSLKSAPVTSMVIGAVEAIPPGKDEYSIIIFMDDTSRGEYSNYGRIVRLPGRNIPFSEVLKNVPYVLKTINFQAALGSDLMLAQLVVNIRRILPQK